MTRMVLLLLACLLSCGPADDAGPTPAGSTSAPAGGQPSEAGAAGAVTGKAAADSEAQGGARTARPRAVFLGTSLTAGFGLLRDSDRFTDRLQAMADSAGLPVTVINAGVSGETSAGGLRRLDWILQAPTDVLVVELGANDGLRGTDVDSMRENLTGVIRGARARYPEVRIVLAGMEAPPNLGERYTSAFRDAFREVARQEEVILVPFLLEDVAGVPELNQEDRLHPNAEGHLRIARTLWPVLEPVLRDAAELTPRP